MRLGQGWIAILVVLAAGPLRADDGRTKIGEVTEAAGDVRINNTAATVGTLVYEDDDVQTGADGVAVIVFRVREDPDDLANDVVINADLQVEPNSDLHLSLQQDSPRVLCVFWRAGQALYRKLTGRSCGKVKNLDAGPVKSTFLGSVDAQGGARILVLDGDVECSLPADPRTRVMVPAGRELRVAPGAASLSARPSAPPLADVTEAIAKLLRVQPPGLTDADRQFASLGAAPPSDGSSPELAARALLGDTPLTPAMIASGGSVLNRAGLFGSAFTVLARADSRAPVWESRDATATLAQVKEQMAVAAYMKGDTAEASGLLGRSLELRPNPATQMQQAYVLRHQNPDEALRVVHSVTRTIRQDDPSQATLVELGGTIHETCMNRSESGMSGKG